MNDNLLSYISFYHKIVHILDHNLRFVMINLANIPCVKYTRAIDSRYYGNHGQW